MKDAHAAVIDLDGVIPTSFFGVYDGHGGPAVAKFCTKHLHIELIQQLEIHNTPYAIQRSFFRMDVMLRDRSAGKELSKYGASPYEGPVEDGCTACVALIRGNRIFVGNAGDSRCVLSKNRQAIPLSRDHTPFLPSETRRIEKARSAAVMNQVRGDAPEIGPELNISRSIGDVKFKENHTLFPQDQILIAFPDVHSEEITEDTDFLVIASKGIWKCMNDQQIVNYVSMFLENGSELSYICDSLLCGYLQNPKGGEENMTIIIVRFKRPAEAHATLEAPACQCH